MADSKITALTAISTVDPTADPLVIVDVSDTSMAASGTTKKSTINQLLGSGGTATLASATITGDLTVDTSTLKVDSANDRVGIGTASPAAFKLHVNGASGNQMVLSNGGEQFTLVEFRNSTTAKAQQYWDNTNTIFENYLSSGSHAFTWKASATEWMRLNATGLGVGVVPGSFGRFSVQGTAGGAGILGMNTDATQCDIQSYNKPLAINRAGNNITMCEGGGNVGVGVTPSAKFHSKAGAVTQGGIIETSGANALLSFADAGTSSYTRVQIGSSGNNLAAFINSVQAMTLDASGNLLVGTTNPASNGGIGLKAAYSATAPYYATVGSSNASNAYSYLLYSTTDAAFKFYVSYSGTVSATNGTISAISDARLKENVQDIDVGLGAILALKPRKFDWKEGKGKNIKGDRGFIAQEFEQVFPNLVDEWKDNAPEGEAPYKSVRQDLIPVLVKAIQELTARVEALEA